MKDKIKNFVSQYKKVDGDKRSGYFYGIIFVFIFLLAVILKFTGNLSHPTSEASNNTKDKETTNTQILEYETIFKEIGNNYEEDVIIYLYDTLAYADFNDALSGRPLTALSKKYFINIKKDKENEEKSYMDLKNAKVDDNISDNVDTIFVDPENILELLKANTFKKNNKYMVETNSWIKLYNELTEKNIEKKVTGEIEIEMLSYDKNGLKLSLNLTNLYKNTSYDYAKVIYDINIYNIGETILSNKETE